MMGLKQIGPGEVSDIRLFCYYSTRALVQIHQEKNY